ncbi:MAG: DHA1 family tetracycline resistance protein-like MFS transporter, partial [Paracoccaceae bacterium]
DDQQGELQGALTSINAIATIIAPLLMTQTFWYFTSDGDSSFPGAPFLLSAVLVAICIAIFHADRTNSQAKT